MRRRRWCGCCADSTLQAYAIRPGIRYTPRVRTAPLLIACFLLAGCGLGDTAVIPETPLPARTYPADDLPDVSARGAKVRIPILMYHRIAEVPAGATKEQRRYIVPPDAFRTQLQWLRDNGYEVISLAAFDRIVHGLPEVVPAKPVVLTFDDGFRDALVHALPILQEFDAPATFFIYLWATEKHPREGDRGYMSWEELAVLRDAGMDIASHSMSHAFLATVDAEKVRWEVRESRRLLQENLGVRASAFSYPYSSVNDAVRAELRAAGYSLGLKALGGPDHAVGSGFLDIPRIEVAPDLETFIARVRWEQWAAPARMGSENDPRAILGETRSE